MGHGSHDPDDGLNDERLAELGRLAQKATPGPWTHRTERDPAFIGSSDPAETGEYEIIIRTDHPGLTIVASEMDTVDAELIVAARTFLPALVAEVRRLRATGVS
jgi:hypothetical protein